MSMRMLKWASLLLGILVFAGCCRQPSETDGKKVLEARIRSQSHGLIELVSFEKTDGVRREIMGQKFYDMECTYVIGFTYDCMWDRRALALMGGGGGLFSAVRIEEGRGVKDRNSDLSRQIAQAQGYASVGFKGKQLKFKTTINFQKTEKGWVGSMD